jgi:hypothetical protein
MLTRQFSIEWYSIPVQSRFRCMKEDRKNPFAEKGR